MPCVKGYRAPQGLGILIVATSIGAVNAMFVIGGPMLDLFESGLIAGFFSPEFSVVSGGLACIIATLAVAACVPSLLRVKVK
jgi:hypothetical protein